jgi:iron complex outermembrane recepter protein
MAVNRSVQTSPLRFPRVASLGLRRLQALPFLVLALAIAARAHAQGAAPRDSLIRDSPRRDSLAQTLRSVSVTVTRDAPRSPFELPFALSSAPIAARPAQRRSGIGDLLLAVPGVQVQERANPSQDPRIAVRGFGARSAFGVRGVRIVRDGVPLSLPDGQTPLDWLDLETIDRIDVIRGTAAALYGNAAGGVVELRSREPSPSPLAIDTRFWDGAGVQRTNLIASGTVAERVGPLAQPQWLASFTRTRGDGPRTWSRLDATSGFARAMAKVAGTRVELQATLYDAPRAENTGALTAAELSRDPRLPDSLNITRRSRKAVQQSQVALLAERTVGAGTVRGSIFTGSRTLDNPLPFAMVAVDRQVAGGGVHGAWRVTTARWPIRLGAGIDAQQQRDTRLNYENCAEVLPTAPVTTRCPRAGDERGAVRLNQVERIGGVGGYARLELEAPHGINLSGALRGDQVRFTVNDAFVSATNPDDSGERTLSALSPMVAVNWRIRPRWSLYGNLARAFETPTVTELTNQENGDAGLNQSLAPQRTRTAEVGAQALIRDRVRADLALFDATVLDELVGFDVPGQVGRRAFRNAGQTRRRGAELSLRAEWPLLSVGTSYSYAAYRFDRYVVGTTSFAGNPIPGVPAQYAQGFLTARRNGLWSTVEVTASSRISANDAATVYGAGYAVWNWRAGVASPTWGRVQFEPTVAVENLFDRRYAGSLVLNATRNRFFEPGLPRRLTVLVRAHWQ